MKLNRILEAINRIGNDRFIARNLILIFILIISCFLPNNLGKYLLAGMGVIIVILNLRMEFVTRNNIESNEKKAHS